MPAKFSIFRTLFFLSISINISAQENDISMLDFTLDYSTNSNTFGQFNQLVNQPMYTLSAGFYSKYKVDFSVAGIVSENSDDSLQKATSEMDLMLGYNLKLGNRFLIYPSYSHFFYSKNSNTLKSSISDNLQLDLTIDFKWYNSGVSINYLLGEDDNAFYLFLRNTFVLQKFELFNNDDAFFVQPDLSFIFGNQQYFTMNNLNNYSKYNIRNILQARPLLRRQFWQLVEDNPDLTNREILQLMFTTEEFNLNNIALSVPVSYMYKNFTFSIGLLTFFPINTPEIYDDSPQTYFDFAFSYSLLF